jgi:hypothetical protein
MYIKQTIRKKTWKNYKGKVQVLYYVSIPFRSGWKDGDRIVMQKLNEVV